MLVTLNQRILLVNISFLSLFYGDFIAQLLAQ